MDNIQKQSIREMRGSGLGYKKIAQALDLPLGTVQSFCRRESIPTVAPTIPDENHCKQCGKPLIQLPKIKRRKFCSQECRIEWWTEHPCSKNNDSKVRHTAVCENCGKPFDAYGNKNRKFCSRRCYLQHRYHKQGGDPA